MDRETKVEDMSKDMVVWLDNLPDKWYYAAVQEATNSHAYVRTGEQVPYLSFRYEKWTTLLENPDWAALERSWNEANRQH